MYACFLQFFIQLPLKNTFRYCSFCLCSSMAYVRHSFLSMVLFCVVYGYLRSCSGRMHTAVALTGIITEEENIKFNS